MHIFRVCPFYQATKQHLNSEKLDRCKTLICSALFGSVALVSSVWKNSKFPKSKSCKHSTSKQQNQTAEPKEGKCTTLIFHHCFFHCCFVAWKKGPIPKICMFCFDIINSVPFNLFTCLDLETQTSWSGGRGTEVIPAETEEQNSKENHQNQHPTGDATNLLATQFWKGQEKHPSFILIPLPWLGLCRNTLRPARSPGLR